MLDKLFEIGFIVDAVDNTNDTHGNKKESKADSNTTISSSSLLVNQLFSKHMNFKNNFEELVTTLERLNPKLNDLKKREISSEFNDQDVSSFDLSIIQLIKVSKQILYLNNEYFGLAKNLVSEINILQDKYENQEEFVNVAAHELRTPAQAILGYIDMISLKPANVENYLDLISTNAERLHKLVTDILDTSRIERDMLILNKENFNIVNLIDRAVYDVNSKIAGETDRVQRMTVEQYTQIPKDYEFTESLDNKLRIKDLFNNNYEHSLVKRNVDCKEIDTIVINADINRINQVIYNLLNNSLRFASDGIIKVEISVLTNDHLQFNKSDKDHNGIEYETIDDQSIENYVLIRISDKGIGINPMVFSKLFTKFASDPSAGGTGLGLYISKKIVEAHGGKIWAENNKKGKGATVSFMLPI
jgi:signal transduction histidine kinase